MHGTSSGDLVYNEQAYYIIRNLNLRNHPRHHRREGIKFLPVFVQDRMDVERMQDRSNCHEERTLGKIPTDTYSEQKLVSSYEF